MPFKYISFLAGLAAVLAQDAASTCNNYVIISTRGTFEHQGPSIGFKDMIAWTLGNVTGGVEYDTVYPAAQNQTFYLGTDDVVRYIDAGVQSCPDQRYLLLGYSQGASVTDAALYNYTDPESAGYKAIAAVLLIGNPYKIPDKVNDVDQLGGSSNRQLRGSLYNTSLPVGYGNGIPEVFYTSNKLIDICYENDPVCAPQSAHANLTAHILYGGSLAVQNMGTRFLVSKLGGATTNSTNGTSPTTSASGSSGSSIPVSTSTPSSTSSTTVPTGPASGLAVAVQMPALWTTIGLALVSAFLA
ncbi:MAG: hypothetical protein GOMPHAMPRED_006162 [Gomphillus americanus]|uniref:Cutinase n=1 Tax=Gomphillus americanus TaxID=1940652 RepID=A0A8H3I9Q7_9LECA|nr:MAG: hypothetical protein GOMPHAMPRED_006162 [Gomphillus americanus]